MFRDNFMYGEKLERLGVTKNDLNTSIRKIGLDQKCQAVYAGVHQIEMEDLEAGGEAFEAMLDKQKVK